MKLVSIRVMLALIVFLDLELEKLDFKTMFLHGDLDEDIYIYGTTRKVCSGSK